MSPKLVRFLTTYLLPALAGSGCGSARVLVVPRPRKKQSPAYTLRRSVRFGSSASVRLVVSPALLVAGVRAHVERLRGRHRSRGALELADGVLVHRAHELDAGLDVFEPWGVSTGRSGRERRRERKKNIVTIACSSSSRGRRRRLAFRTCVDDAGGAQRGHLGLEGLAEALEALHALVLRGHPRPADGHGGVARLEDLSLIHI